VKVLPDRIEINVKVKPGSRFEAIEMNDQGEFVIKVRAKPIDGEANVAVIQALSDYLKIAKSRISLSSGAKSKTKRFAISRQVGDDSEVQESLKRLLVKK